MNVDSYSIDGIPLENPAFGWVFRGPSKPLSNLTVRRPALQIPGMPGVLADPDPALTNLEPPMPTLMIQTPREHYDALLSLLADGSMLSITDQPHRQARYELLSTSYEGYGNGDSIIDVTATIHLPGVFWRDADSQDFTQALTANSHTVDLWEMSGLVTDALIRVRAPFTGLRITSRSAVLEYSALITAGAYLRYDCAAGRAFITTTDTWTGGTPANGASEGGTVNADGPGDKFAIFPTRIDPYTRKGRIVVTTVSRGLGTQIQVRGRGAHLV